MPEIFENSYEEFSSPVVSLTEEGLPLSKLIKQHQTEFEVRPEEDEEDVATNAPESQFNFDQYENLLNWHVHGDEQEEDNSEDDSPFDKYRRKMFDVREDGKVKKYVTKQGEGALVPDNCVVYIRYQAYVEYGEIPFDSTVWQCNGEGDIPVAFDLAKGQLLPGLYEGILSMRKGEKAEFLVHPDLAYGKFGCPPRIPPEATVLFIVEVDRFVDCGDIHVNKDDLSEDERNQYSNIYKSAKGHHALGNDLFKKENFSAAVTKYRTVINMMHNARLANEQEEKERNHFLLKNYTNACVCYHKMRKYRRVCVAAADAVRVNENEALRSYKLLYFWGYAKMMLGDYTVAKKHLLAAQKLKPKDTDIAFALKELEKKKQDALVQEKIMMQKAFGFKQEEVKITEINETDELRKTISEVLEEFKNNHQKNYLLLKDEFTREEEQLYVRAAKDLGLYARVIDGEKRVVEIKKPYDM